MCWGFARIKEIFVLKNVWVAATHEMRPEWKRWSREQLPSRYRHWVRITVVGRVIGTANQEPVLLLMYVRGWAHSGQNEDVWETVIDPAYMPVIPEGLHGEFQAQ